MIGADYPFLDVLWTLIVIFAWVIWFWLLIVVFSDLFRRRDVSGWGKAAWIIFVVLLPYLGVLVYLIARGRSMGERDMQEAKASREAFDSYVRQTAGTGASTADELTKLADLQAKGVISPAEFEQQKAKLLS